ncbi:ATP synthase F1 subcomplex delta subunit [Acidothermus cellulolyticus 11B]|jgi:F-type H+-transporting ATPase subunit delta|uniref:ATP synthase subunit delta n=1 Tax=Acidothermus cellulolyticus (strain ATCC 43068 / DSM 8971 / 11B) TaxID=351607 RepID=ATPD_ACIC1|nr:F0F1 ATP synthase subunit delta [Acidothermus cellulolyticus]A0LSL3.1 RecName: Full=ATP synthase subunit delta; AltName: Full=ATP synthase F(1) sector subunit delta; AltName: Full=F-type ATPase subunit delta; Short=F-ATPase subunit delta [Acidothermus cellulolyticus 11B]ABK52423.1 ATP synthase F1 subcomplex delta subunit [Acidothermus cellulolyticus 11B]
MQGASRESLAAAWREAEELLVRPRPGAQPPEEVGTQLFSVTAILDEHPALRRALSDPAVEPGRKVSLADRLFGERIGETARRLVATVVRARWSRVRDLSDALETLGVLALLVAAERSRAVDDVEDELFRFGRIVASRPELRDALANRTLPVENKVRLVERLLADRAHPVTVALVTQLVRHPRGRTPEEGFADFSGIAARFRQRLVARVTTAVALTDDERSRLRRALSELYGRDVHLHVEVDPRIGGGVVVQLGDEVIDGSIASILAETRQRLAS